MSLLGKIFAFLNILGVAGVLVMGMMTYSKKTAWANANAQQLLRLEGLPLNEQDLDKNGNLKLPNLNEANVKAVVPGPVVLTQVAEVQRVHGLVQGHLEKFEATPDKLLALVGVLKPFAQEYGRYSDLVLMERGLGGVARDPNEANQQRTALKTQLSQIAEQAETLVKNPPKDAVRTNRTYDEAFREFAHVQRTGAKDPFVEAYLAARTAAQTEGKPTDFESVYTASLNRLLTEAQAELESHYQSALSGKMVTRDGTSPSAGPALQRFFIVRYLYNIAPVADPEGMKGGTWAPPAIERVVGIVGLENFPAAILDQAARIGVLTQTLEAESNLPNTVSVEVIKQLNRDRLDFANQHRQMLDYLKELSAVVKERQDRVAAAEKVANDQEALAAASKKLNEDLDAILKVARTDVSKELEVIRALSKSLLEVRLKARDAAEYNQKLEQEIRRLERLYR